MKKTFNPVNFEDPLPDHNPVKKIEFRQNDTIIEKLIASVKEEIVKLQEGTSEHRRAAIYLEKNTCPAITALDRFEKNPTPETLRKFLVLSEQDFGRQIYKVFREWSVNAFEKGEAYPGAAGIPEKPFPQEIKNLFYDLFKVNSVTLSQTQVDRLNGITESIARSLEKEILSRLKRLQLAVSEAFAVIDKQLNTPKKTPKKEEKTDVKEKVVEEAGDGSSTDNRSV